MKTFLLCLLSVFTIGYCSLSLADTVVTEYGVPITVQDGSTYVVSEPAYYYYSGYRCYAKERPDISANFLGLKASVGSGTQIYCYTYP